MLSQDDASQQALVQELRRVLRHLYDPDELRHSPLVRLLPVDPHEGPLALQRLLMQAIESLRPGAGMPPASDAWRTYHTLSSRYVRQFTQSEVARSLVLSLRQMRREESRALHRLAEVLWQQYGLEEQTTLRLLTADGAAPLAILPAQAPSRDDELRWLERSQTHSVIPVAELVEAVVRTVRPLALALQVDLLCDTPTDGLALLAQPAAARQALLNTLTVAMQRARGGQLSLSAARRDQQVELCIRAVRPAADHSPAQPSDKLEMAQELARLCGGALRVSPGGAAEPFEMRLSFPAPEQALVLAIDDNTDTLQLLQRYLAGTSYTFLGLPDPKQALTTAAQMAPRVIILDVMLPGVDGWELLGQLREHPRLRGCPIAVCTILPQEELALNLGAAAFLRKPVSRAALLAELERLTGLSSP